MYIVLDYLVWRRENSLPACSAYDITHKAPNLTTSQRQQRIGEVLKLLEEGGLVNARLLDRDRSRDAVVQDNCKILLCGIQSDPVTGPDKRFGISLDYPTQTTEKRPSRWVTRRPVTFFVGNPSRLAAQSIACASKPF